MKEARPAKQGTETNRVGEDSSSPTRRAGCVLQSSKFPYAPLRIKSSAGDLRGAVFVVL